tara:strand:+ start:1450 stop:3492 length:2043 start_codon:yes stop_codon:yes gene_type:complete
MAYENSFQQLTRSLSKQKDGTVSLYRRYAKRPTNRNGSGNGWAASMLSDFMNIGTHYLTQLVAEKKAEEQSIKAADMNFMGNASTQKAVAGLDKEDYERFLKVNMDKMREGNAAVKKYKSDSKEYQEGTMLIQEANQAVNNAAANKDRYKLMEQRVAGIDLNNMDNTVSFEAALYTAQINNGSFWKKNEVYLTDDGDYMTRAKIGEKRVIDQASFDEMDEYTRANYLVGDEDLGDTINGNKLTTDQWQLMNNGEKISGSGIDHSQSEIDPNNPNQGHKVVSRKATNIFDLPLGYANQQLLENSFQNTVENYLDVQQKKGYMHLTANDGGGTDVLKDIGGREELEKDVTTMLSNLKPNQLRSYVHNGQLEIPVTTIVGGKEVTKIETRHPAEVLLWARGIDNPKLNNEELKLAEAAWDKKDGEGFTFTMEFDPSKKGTKADGGDDIDVTWKTRDQYEASVRAYDVTSQVFASSEQINEDDKKILVNLIADNAQAANQVGVEKYDAEQKRLEKERLRKKFEQSNYEQKQDMKKKARQKSFDNISQVLVQPEDQTPEEIKKHNGDPMMKVSDPSIQIKWFKDENPDARDWAEKRDLKFRDVGEKHPGTDDKLDVGAYFYIKNTNNTGEYLGMTEPIYETVEEIDEETGKIKKVKKEVVAAEALFAPIYEIWNEGRTLDIDNEF